VVRFTAERFGRAIVMPNLQPAVTTTELAAAYRRRILSALSTDARFTPLMTLYLTDSTAPAEIDRASQAGFVAGVKLYPAGATTHSEAGVTDIRNTYAVLERMQEIGMPLLVHGETTRAEVDVFDRETSFIDELLVPLIERFAKLKVVLEHITTARAGEFVARARGCCGNHYTPASVAQSQCDLFGRDQASLLLPADPEARTRSARAGGSRHGRQPAVFPGNRQRAP
jgi:dihydroorotase